jgi:cytochrome c oxidase assembly protein subunit 15
VVAQAVLGGITVMVKLAPGWVMAHFLLSMVVIADGVVLFHRAGLPDGAPARPRVAPGVVRTSRALVGLTALVLGLGTVVTGAGPHSGAAGVGRLPLSARDAAELHSAVVMLLIGVAAATVWMLEPGRAPRPVRRGVRLLVGALAVQAAIGYTQYFTGVPAWLVELHVIGAVVIWVAVLGLHLTVSMGTAPAPPDPGAMRPGRSLDDLAVLDAGGPADDALASA